MSGDQTPSERARAWLRVISLVNPKTAIGVGHSAHDHSHTLHLLLHRGVSAAYLRTVPVQPSPLAARGCVYTAASWGASTCPAGVSARPQPHASRGKTGRTAYCSYSPNAPANQPSRAQQTTNSGTQNYYSRVARRCRNSAA